MLIYEEIAEIEEKDAKEFAEGKTKVLKYKGQRLGIRIYSDLAVQSKSTSWLVDFKRAGVTEEEFAEGLKKGYLKVKNVDTIHLI